MKILQTHAVLALVVLSTLALSVEGDSSKFGDCPDDRDCEMGPSGDLFPPDAVTGHSVYASWRVTLATSEGSGDGDGVPTALPPADVPGLPSERRPLSAPAYSGWDLAQAECIAWSNGKNIDIRPDPDPVFAVVGEPEGFLSDEDETTPGAAAQDYDHGRFLSSCVPFSARGGTAGTTGAPTDFAVVMAYMEYEDPTRVFNGTVSPFPEYMAVVERGDCDPATGTDFRYRGHLDFVDPNHVYHEVQEYDYVCSGLGAGSGPAGNLVPAAPGGPAAMSDAVKALFPWSYTGANATDGCAQHETPTDGNGHFDLGHKCNGSVQDLFTERVWITVLNSPTYDRATGEYYNFALAVDTCSGLNVHEHSFFTGLDPHETDATDYLLDGLGSGRPLAEVCHDGSSFSFDDTARGRTTHSSPPASSWGIARGNAYDHDPDSSTFGKHRQNCRSNHLDWPFNDYPGQNRAPAGPAGAFEETGLHEDGSRNQYSVGEDCFPEDHKTAGIDVYVYDDDPTGLFRMYSNHMGGSNTYVEGVSTGPDHVPPS